MVEVAARPAIVIEQRPVTPEMQADIDRVMANEWRTGGSASITFTP